MYIPNLATVRKDFYTTLFFFPFFCVCIFFRFSLCNVFVSYTFLLCLFFFFLFTIFIFYVMDELLKTTSWRTDRSFCLWTVVESYPGYFDELRPLCISKSIYLFFIFFFFLVYLENSIPQLDIFFPIYIVKSCYIHWGRNIITKQTQGDLTDTSKKKIRKMGFTSPGINFCTVIFKVISETFL